MRARRIAQKMVCALDDSLENLDPKISKRLHESRQKALAVQRPTEARLGIAGIAATVGVSSRSEILSLRRSALILLALASFAAGTSYWGHVQRQTEIEEVDIALLTDDLPIDAYLDRGFDAWLKKTSFE